MAKIAKTADRKKVMDTTKSTDCPKCGKATRIVKRTNFSGWIQGGISNGEEIYFRVAFKPTATIARKQDSVTSAGKKTKLAARWRHDPCVLPRAVPMVEAMTALVLCDHALRQRAIWQK